METKHAYSTDVVIIGAGPVGLFAVFECGMLKMKCHVVDSLEEIGGQCMALYPEKPIYDIPAAPVLSGGELIERLAAQAAPFRPVYHLKRQVTGLGPRNGRFTVTLSSGDEIDCAAVIIAAGAGAFGPNRPPLDGIETYEGKSVFYMVRRREDFKGKTVVIAGGGDSAVDWAVSLADIAKKVYVVHRRDKFRAAPDTVAKMQGHKNIEMVVPYQLHALHGKDGLISAVEVTDLDNKTRRIDADVLLPFFGLTPQLGPISDWGLGVTQYHIPVDQSTSETTVKGIFAIGDIATYNKKLKLILTGFAEAAQAAHAIHPRVFPGQELHFVYSTSKGVPA
jgi:thioredoxin reductase (NADPH)